MIPTTTRVEQHTDEAVNEQIRRRTEQSISYVGRQGCYEISRRLEDLDHEWDMERTLEANAASITLLGLGLGTFVDRRLFILPAMVAGFLLQHAVQGWCPPVPFFRRLGFRTAREIDSERYALKAIRGDFDDLPATHTIDEEKARRILAVMNRWTNTISVWNHFWAMYSSAIIIRTVLTQGIVEPLDDVLADLLNAVTIDEEQVIVPGVSGTIPLERFIGKWNGPLQPP
jgi:hypothetical protein